MKKKVMLVEFNKINHKGRMYTPESLIPYLQNEILGEIGVPEDSIVNLKKISHRVTNLTIEDNKLFGDVEILDTPEGNLLKTMMDKVVFRPRGIGGIDANNTIIDYTLISFDAIPKDKDSFL